MMCFIFCFNKLCESRIMVCYVFETLKKWLKIFFKTLYILLFVNKYSLGVSILGSPV
jgi:hypothetical protein